MNRRSLLTLTIGTVAVQALPALTRAQVASPIWRHGVSPFGDLKYLSGFKQFDYVNAEAPKAGSARQIALGTYDNVNIVVDGVKGTLALGLDLNYDTLLVPALDEVSSSYGLLAEVRFSEDFSSISFRLRADAKWHDGTSIAPEDVIFSFATFKKLSPQAAANYRHVVKVEKSGAREVAFTVDQPGDRQQIREIWSVGHEPPGSHRTGEFEARWEPHVACKRGDARAIDWICNNVKCVSFAFESIKNGRDIDILRSLSCVFLNFKSKIASHGLNVILFQHGRGIVGDKQNCQAAKTGDELTQEFEPLTSTFGGLERQSRDVAAGV
jgi:hypothetical protein